MSTQYQQLDVVNRTVQFPEGKYINHREIYFFDGNGTGTYRYGDFGYYLKLTLMSKYDPIFHASYQLFKGGGWSVSSQYTKRIVHEENVIITQSISFPYENNKIIQKVTVHD